MVELLIRGVKVDFPKQPYPSQVAYMTKVIEALQTGSNAMLESPTGTGKTLCLLCATLAWQQHLEKSGHKIIPAGGTAAAAAAAKSSSAPKMTVMAPALPIIIYASRTHTQLTQVVAELKNTSYRPKSTILGSREQLCVHERASKLKGVVLNHFCNKLNAKRACSFRANLESTLSAGGTISGESSELLDIEDLVKAGKRSSNCPYFYSRGASESAQLIFMPYNYLLDQSIRKTLTINWENSIIIFDEAHNLERVASDAVSACLSTAELATCIEEMQRVVAILRQDPAAVAESLNGGENASEKGKSGKGNGLGDDSTQKPSLLQSVAILRAMFALEQQIDEIPLHKDAQSSADTIGSAFRSGESFVHMFQKAGFLNDGNNGALLAIELRRASLLLMDAAQAALDEADSSVGGGAAPTYAAEPKLTLFATVFERMLRASKGAFHDYRLFISEEKIKQFTNRNELRVGQPLQNKKTTKKQINYWCFSTGVAMEELIALKTRSVIVTSGTLSPMEAMKEDLRIPFAIELQNPHVIHDRQIMVAAVANGSTGKSLNSSFANRDGTEYKDELGISILSICQTMRSSEQRVKMEFPSATAQGGVLVFFPGYTVMERVVERWQLTGAFDKLKHEMGSIIVESRGRARVQVATADKASNNKPAMNVFSLNSLSEASAKAESTSEEAEEEMFANVMKQFDIAMAQYKSCLLLAVCRGKVSEGIDFSNNKGRIVIVTGIPFAPYMDPWVVLKKSYLDDKASRSTASAPSTTQPLPVPPAPGNSWALAVQSLTPAMNPPAVMSAVMPAPPGPRVSVARGRGSVSGQMWYNQSAIRAVNQCLGRVIRHKNDWGAIYLLDDRFQNEQQLAQLSGWLRPAVKKYKLLKDSLVPLTNFFVNIARDSELRFVPTQEASVAVHRRTVSQMRSSLATKPSDPILRYAQLSSADLSRQSENGADEELSFIDPNLLSSQSVEIRHSPDEQNKIRNAGMVFPRDQSQQQSQRPVDDNAIKRLVSKNGLISNRAVVSGRETSLFGLQDKSISRPSLTSRSMEPNPSTVSATSTTFGLRAGVQQGDSSWTSFSQDEFSSQATQPLPAATTTATTANFLSRKAILSNNVSSEQRDSSVRQAWGKIKTQLSTDKQMVFQQLMRRTKSSGPPATVSQVKDFADALHSIFLSLSPDLTLEIMTDLAILMPDKPLMSVFTDEARKHVSSRKHKRVLGESRVSQSEQQDESQMATQPLPSQLVPPPVEDLSNAGSKRARVLLQASKGLLGVGPGNNTATQRNAQSSLLSKLREWSSSKESNAELARQVMEPAKSKFRCTICQETTGDPCAARCGHVCCQQCWVKCLALKPECPVCRAPTTLSSITKLQVTKL